MSKTSSNPLQFIIGIILALGAGVSMYFGTFPLAARITVGIIGLLLITTSKYRLM